MKIWNQREGKWSDNMKNRNVGLTIVLCLVIIFAIVGIVQEFLIKQYTPKAAIDRKLLRQVSHYLQWSSIEERERFLIEVYVEYKGDGVINQEQFDFKCKKCVET